MVNNTQLACTNAFVKRHCLFCVVGAEKVVKVSCYRDACTLVHLTVAYLVHAQDEGCVYTPWHGLVSWTQ